MKREEKQRLKETIKDVLFYSFFIIIMVIIFFIVAFSLIYFILMPNINAHVAFTSNNFEASVSDVNDWVAFSSLVVILMTFIIVVYILSKSFGKKQ